MRSGRRLGKDTGGQLLLVTGIILAIALLSLAVISVKVTNVGHRMAEPHHTLAEEVDDIDRACAMALDSIANHLHDSSPLDARTCIEMAFTNVTDALRGHESRYGYAFSATMIEISDGGNPYSITITMSVSDGAASFTLQKAYLITFEY